MPTRTDVAKAVKSLGIPARYGYFEGDQAAVTSMPYVTYRMKLDSPDYAEDARYHVTERYDVELDESSKDFALESKLESALESARIPYTKYEYQQTDGWLSVIYETSVDKEA